jgi:hypothetical protein
VKAIVRILALALAACGSVGCGGDDGPNRGSQCTQVLQVVCNRLGTTCQVFPANEVGVCVQSGVAACCSGSCSASVVSTQAEIDTCIADINATPCAELDVTAGGALPATCVGVVRSSLVSRASGLAASVTSPGETVGRLISQ